MGFKRKHPESKLDELASRQNNTLGVFDTVVSSLERIAAEAEQVRDESHSEAERHHAVATIANIQAGDAKKKAQRIRELFQ